MFLIKLVAGDFGLPASEVGFTEAGALGASFHEGEEDILNRQTRMPDAKWLGKLRHQAGDPRAGHAGRAARRGARPGVRDEAAADAVALQRVQNARMTLNEDGRRAGSLRTTSLRRTCRC